MRWVDRFPASTSCACGYTVRYRYAARFDVSLFWAELRMWAHAWRCPSRRRRSV